MEDDDERGIGIGKLYRNEDNDGGKKKMRMG